MILMANLGIQSGHSPQNPNRKALSSGLRNSNGKSLCRPASLAGILGKAGSCPSVGWQVSAKDRF